MKVLLIDVYNYNKGGAETVCFNSGKLLEEHGHKVIYFTLKWEKNLPSPYSKYFPESKETRKGVFRPIINLINYFYHFEAARKIEQLIVKEQPDIAHIHLLWGQITPSIFPILKKHNIPIVFTVHDYRIVCPAYTFRNGKGEICEKCQGKYFYKCFINNCTKGSRLLSAIMASEQYFRNIFFNPAKYIDGFIYVSNFAREIQEKHMPTLKTKSKITLYNFSMEIENENNKEEDNGDKYFLFLGRLSYEKGVFTLLKAFKDMPQCKLKVVGTGPLDKELKNYCLLNNMQNVIFEGYRTGQELIDFVKNAYFVVVPSEWYENNPMTIIESYSLGVPVIGAKIGGIPEIIKEKETGFLFNSGDVADLKKKIETANQIKFNDYKELKNNAIKFSKNNFERESYFKKLLIFYNSFLNK